MIFAVRVRPEANSDLREWTDLGLRVGERCGGNSMVMSGLGDLGLWLFDCDLFG